MPGPKVGSRKKGRRSSKKKPYYAAFRANYVFKVARRKANRDKRVEAALAQPGVGSPSQIELRKKAINRMADTFP